MKLQIKVDPRTDIIIDAKFKTFGCGSAIASSEYATQYIINKKLQEAFELTNKNIAEYLKLPPVKLHCSLLAEDAIKMAIEDYSKNK
jgi:nitrogen fixation NifU-like protein